MPALLDYAQLAQYDEITMVDCDICDKSFKTAQGLAGHRQFAHGEVRSPQQTTHSSFVTNEQLSELVEGLQAAMDEQIEVRSELLEQEFKTSLEQLKEHLPTIV